MPCTSTSFGAAGVGDRLDARRVALEAARRDRAVEVGDPVREAGAVRPAEPRPVRHRQLVQLVAAAPVDVRLALPPRADDVGEALRARRGVRRCAEDRGLRVSVRRRVHPVAQIGIRRAQLVRIRLKSSADRVARRVARRQPVRRALEGRAVAVAGEAGGVRDGGRRTHGLRPVAEREQRRRRNGERGDERGQPESPAHRDRLTPLPPAAR